MQAFTTQADTYDAAVLADGPLGYWPLREGAGSTTAVDRSGGPDGLIQGNVMPGDVPGPVDGTTAFTFGGAPCDGVDLDANGTRLQLSQLTLEAWIRTTTTLDLPIVLRNRSFGYQINAGAGGVQVGVYPVGTSSTAIAVNDGKWHHIVGTYGPSGEVLYVDGIQVGTGDYGGEPQYTRNEIAIGRDGDACDGVVPSFDGDIADVAIYPTVLSPAAVLNHYQAAHGSTVPTLPSLDGGTFVAVTPTGGGTGEACTTGFAVKKGGVRYEMTAEHCFTPGFDPTNAPTTPPPILPNAKVTTLGGTTSYVFNQALDCKTPSSQCLVPSLGQLPIDMVAFQPDSSKLTNQVQVDGRLLPVVGEVPSKQLSKGDTVCHYGNGVGGEKCGDIASKFDKTNRLFTINAKTKCSDSGGPVYQYVPNKKKATGVVILGMMVRGSGGVDKQGNCKVGNQGQFIAIDDIEARLGVKLVQ